MEERNRGHYITKNLEINTGYLTVQSSGKDSPLLNYASRHEEV